MIFLIYLLGKHHLDLRLRELLVSVLVFVVFYLLLTSFDLDHLAFFVFQLVGVGRFWLLKNADLVPELFKVLLLDNLVQMFFRKGKLLWVLFVLFLKVLQK